MALTDAQRLAREGKLTASRVAPLMTGDKAKIMAVWRELCGDPTYEEESLDDIWHVRLGETTEGLNLDWYERTTGKSVSRRGEVVDHPDLDWACATLDGFDMGLGAPIECKHVNGFEKFESVVQKYYPQCHWQMECTGTKKCVMSVIEGARKPRIEIIDYDKDYADELMARALRLMEHVWSMTPPVDLEPVVAKRISAMKDYNMTGNNHWASWAADWIANRDAADKFDVAEKRLRELIPNDAATVTGYGVVARRDRANRLSIKGIDDKPKSKSKR